MERKPVVAKEIEILPDHPSLNMNVSHVWSNLLHMNYRVNSSLLIPLIHPKLQLDEFNGSSWVSLIPTQITKTTINSFPFPITSTELTLQTYVSLNGKPGNWPLRLFFGDRLVAWFAKLYYRGGVKTYPAIEMDIHADHLPFVQFLSSEMVYPDDPEAAICNTSYSIQTDQPLNISNDAVTFFAQRSLDFEQDDNGNLFVSEKKKHELRRSVGSEIGIG